MSLDMGIDSKVGADPSRHRELNSEPTDFRVGIANTVRDTGEAYIRSGRDGLEQYELAQKTRDRLAALHARIAGIDLSNGAEEVLLTAKTIEPSARVTKQTPTDVMHRALYESTRDNDERYRVNRQYVDLIANPQEIAELSEAKALLAKVLRARNQAVKMITQNRYGDTKNTLVFVDPKYPNCLVKIEVTKVVDTGSRVSSERMMLVMYEPSAYQAEMAKLQVEVDERKQMELAQAAKAQATEDERRLAEAQAAVVALARGEIPASTIGVTATEVVPISGQPQQEVSPDVPAVDAELKAVRENIAALVDVSDTGISPSAQKAPGESRSQVGTDTQREAVGRAEPRRTLDAIAIELKQLIEGGVSRDVVFARAIAMAGNLADRNASIIQLSLQKLQANGDDRAYVDKLRTFARPLYEELSSRKMIR